MKISAQEWIAKGKQMFFEEFPDSYEIFGVCKKWNSHLKRIGFYRRSEIAQLCGEASRENRYKVHWSTMISNQFKENLCGESSTSRYSEKTELLVWSSYGGVSA